MPTDPSCGFVIMDVGLCHIVMGDITSFRYFFDGYILLELNE